MDGKTGKQDGVIPNDDNFGGGDLSSILVEPENQGPITNQNN